MRILKELLAVLFLAACMFAISTTVSAADVQAEPVQFELVVYVVTVERERIAPDPWVSTYISHKPIQYPAIEASSEVSGGDFIRHIERPVY